MLDFVHTIYDIIWNGRQIKIMVMILVIQVKKRDGSKETFDPEKMKRAMQKAAIDATYSLEGAVDLTLIEEISEDITREAKEKGEIDTTTIREKILSRLEKMGSSIAESWKKFEGKYKR